MVTIYNFLSLFYGVLWLGILVIFIVILVAIGVFSVYAKRMQFNKTAWICRSVIILLIISVFFQLIDLPTIPIRQNLNLSSLLQLKITENMEDLNRIKSYNSVFDFEEVDLTERFPSYDLHFGYWSKKEGLKEYLFNKHTGKVVIWVEILLYDSYENGCSAYEEYRKMDDLLHKIGEEGNCEQGKYYIIPPRMRWASSDVGRYSEKEPTIFVMQKGKIIISLIQHSPKAVDVSETEINNNIELLKEVLTQLNY